MTTLTCLLGLLVTPLADDDAKKLQGEWKLVTLEADGETLTASQITGGKLTVTGEKYKFQIAGQTEEGTMKFHADKKPKAVDVKIEVGNDKGKSQYGIYEWDGAKIKFCFALAGQPEAKRPKEFKTMPGSGDALFVFEKVAK